MLAGSLKSIETDHAGPFKLALTKQYFAIYGIDHVIAEIDAHKATGLTRRYTIQTNAMHYKTL